VNLVARTHQQVRRQRQDFYHKTALARVRANDTIYSEDVQIRDMVWYTFLTILSSKATCAGREVIVVDPAFTSQHCSGCGVLVSTGVSVRWHRRPECGTSLHRDHNAAKKRERFGQSRRGAVA
jgi:putative transposase